jgi:23S rRNA (cytidine1920-2'-O)/16S rRNA (cytidine1409-2'-O)-methyltransferase
MERNRLDILLTQLGYADSRSKAQSLIKAGSVYVDGVRTEKPSTDVSSDATIEVRGDHCPYVSRGGLKLEKALRDFGVDPTGLVCSDAGASTGGFTDCLLQQGAKKVFAIDVGTDQLVEKIRIDPRVVVMEQTNIRYLTPANLGELLDLSVLDVSFISLSLVLPTIRNLLKEDSGQVICLIKPQFEAGKAAVGKKGVVRDPAIHKRVLDDFLQLASQLDFTVLGLTFSPVRGPEGNIEFLAHLTRKKQESKQIDTGSVVRLAHETLKV